MSTKTTFAEALNTLVNNNRITETNNDTPFEDLVELSYQTQHFANRHCYKCDAEYPTVLPFSITFRSCFECNIPICLPCCQLLDWAGKQLMCPICKELKEFPLIMYEIDPDDIFDNLNYVYPLTDDCISRLRRINHSFLEQEKHKFVALRHRYSMGSRPILMTYLRDVSVTPKLVPNTFLILNDSESEESVDDAQNSVMILGDVPGVELEFEEIKSDN